MSTNDRHIPSPLGEPEVGPHASACRLFTVRQGVRRLEGPQLEALTRAFADWVEASRDERTRRSRERVNLVFLVLRYTGARLGEVLGLDERKDLDLEQGLVRIEGHGPEHAEDGSREVPLPQEVVDQLRNWVERHDDEALFAMDQGFLRRKFHEQEEASGIPRELLNPRVLRNSRAVELLQGGMPMRAVQSMLGHTRADFTASYVTLAQNDVKQIINQHCQREFGGATSARNTFHGRVAEVAANPVLCEVVLRTESGLEVAAVITNQSREKLGLEPGVPATALVKATWVHLDRVDAEGVGAERVAGVRNAFPGRITSVLGDEIVTEVQGELDDGTPVCALVASTGFNRLGLGKGDTFVFQFSALSVIIS